MTFNKVLVVKGEDPKQMGKLFELTEANRPDLVILMGDFYYPEEISRLRNQAADMKMGFDYFVETLGDEKRRDLVNNAILSAMAWIETILHLNNIGCYVYVLGGNFPVFYRDRGMRRSVDFGRLMWRSLERKISRKKWRYFDNIDVVNTQESSVVFWPKHVQYQDQLYGYKSELKTVLVTDQKPTKEQMAMVSPLRVISPFTGEKCSLK